MREFSTDIAWDSVPLFLRMIGDYSVGKVGDYEDCSHNLDQLLQLARIHGLVPVIHYMLKNQRAHLAEQRPELVEQMKDAYYSAICQSLTQEESMKQMQEVFSGQGIQLVFFKGAQLRELYPVPELRTMADMDCMIHQKDRARAHELMCQLGYQCQKNNEPVWVYSQGTVIIEMHTKIAGNRVGNGFDYQSFFSDAMDHVVMHDNQWQMETEYYFCYLIYHIAKHLSVMGAGVRMIADIAAFLHHCCNRLDWKQVEEMLKKSHLWEIALAVCGLCHRWFGMEQPVKFCGSEQLLDDLETYIVSGGTYGFETHDCGEGYRRKALQSSASHKGMKYTISLLRVWLFPSKSYLVNYFPPAEKHPWLLPLAWGCRCWLGVFRRKGRSLVSIHAAVKGDINRSHRELLMLKEIGL